VAHGPDLARSLLRARNLRWFRWEPIFLIAAATIQLELADQSDAPLRRVLVSNALTTVVDSARLVGSPGLEANIDHPAITTTWFANQLENAPGLSVP
jgi:hypothetical protein